MTRALFLIRRLPTLSFAAALLVGSALPGAAQIQNPPPGVPAPGARQPITSDEGGVWQQQQQKAMQKQANLQRQQEIKKDTEKLLELATELKQLVDKSSENTLSLDVIKKAEQIEKLARSVKEKMKGP